jgi:hypothetical protein
MLMGTLPPPETRPNICLWETPKRVIGLQTGTAALHLAPLTLDDTVG